MSIVEFDPSLHMESLISILRSRSTYEPTRDEMPEIGFIAFEGSEPIATAFIRRCEGQYALVDTLTSNPHSSSSLRHAAQDLLIQRCISEAKHRGIKQLFAFTANKGTLERSIRNGFEQLPHTIVGIDLSTKV